MKEASKNFLTVSAIIVVTISIILLLASIPNYLRPLEESDIAFTQLKFIIIFAIVDLLLIGIPAGVHYIYVKDYSRVKSTIFFAIFGGIVGAFLGEILKGRNPLVIISYIILMFIYAQFYKRFSWWKVALTTYFAGVLIESGINKSPIQIPSLIWVGFFICPYFATKIWENRKNISIIQIIKDFKWPIFFSVFLTALMIYCNLVQLIFFSLTIPLVIGILYRIFNKDKKEVSMISTLINLKYTISSSLGLMILAIYVSRNNFSPPLIIFGAILPFLITILYRFIRKRKQN